MGKSIENRVDKKKRGVPILRLGKRKSLHAGKFQYYQEKKNFPLIGRGKSLSLLWRREEVNLHGRKT